ncbi:MAG: YcaO-like family protein [Sphingorhabdus sp.]
MSRRDNLPRPLPEAALGYIGALPPGRIVGFPITPLDRTGVPVWVVALFLDDALGLVGAQPSGVGYGATDGDAILGALGEIAECIAPTLALMRQQKVRGSYHEILRNVGENAIADPLTLGLPAGSPVGRDTRLDWVEAKRWSTHETVLVPIDIAACDTFELSDGYEPFTTLITNGLGAGPDIDWAVGHGVLELLQRDGNGLLFRALDQGVLLDLPTDLNGEAGAMVAMFAEQGIRIYPKFATDEFGLTNLYVVGHDEPGQGPRVPIMLSACGEACDPNRERALVKAMREFAAARVRKTFAHGPMEEALAVGTPHYVETFVKKALVSLDNEESRALQAMLDWAQTDTQVLRTYLADSVYSVKAHKPFAELPTIDPAPIDSRAAGRIAMERLAQAGFDILYVDVSPPGGGYSAVKVIVPNLEVETMSYYRIGERNTAKLIARDHPLIRFGEATDTLLPVRISDEAIARVGGRQPLFDTALADAIVGPLYPLYREPEAHHVAYRLGKVKVAA